MTNEPISQVHKTAFPTCILITNLPESSLTSVVGLIHQSLYCCPEASAPSILSPAFASTESVQPRVNPLTSAKTGPVASGVDGVKVDCQAGVGLIGSVLGGGPAVSAKFHAALEKSVATHFPGNLMINCMCHTTENIYRWARPMVRHGQKMEPPFVQLFPVVIANSDG